MPQSLEQSDLLSRVRTAFMARRPFTLDTFQVQAMDAIDNGDSVVVAAPTGSGKTLVAEYAIAIAHETGNRAFYTTPLKALSNQKYADLLRTYGADQVGLLTGDNVINGDAPIIVMTTEVLRNMIYVNSPALQGLQYVVLDEVHYLQNAYRGPVWEEVIIHLPPEVDLVCLSATVSNAEELADWIGTVRGSTVAIIEESRPVALEQHFMVAARGVAELTMIPTFLPNGKPNPRGQTYDILSKRPWQRHAKKQRYLTPQKPDVLERLHAERMLPAIYFIFSRNGCNEAAVQCVHAGLRFTTPQEREEIREIAERKVDGLSDDDLHALGYGEWLHALECGIATHHAGMIPPFKEAVEECFVRALVKVVFATETLALGINMPARTVVIEKLTKFTGERHEPLTPGEFTQLTGRAGRRGIDEVGHAVTLWSPFRQFGDVVALASARSYVLTSSFKPTYNMAANLVRRYPPDVAHHLLNLSFAQYRSDGDIVRLEKHLDRVLKRLAVARANAQCERGDVVAWRSKAKELASNDKRDTHEFIEKAVSHLHIGDVIRDPGTDRTRHLLIITTANRRGHDTKLGVLTTEGRRFSLTARDFFVAPHRVLHVELPKPYNPGNKEFIRRCATSLEDRLPQRDQSFVPRHHDHAIRGPGGCPDVAVHVQALDEIAQLERERVRLTNEAKSRAESLARHFDRVLGLLRERSFVDDWALTGDGVVLAQLYHESDLLIVECIRKGVFENLDPQSLAAIVSTLTYESRGVGTAERDVIFPTKMLNKRWRTIKAIWSELTATELSYGLNATRMPDAAFLPFAFGWMQGRDLGELLDASWLSGGDFVRNIKQLIDLLQQIAQVSRGTPLSGVADAARDRLFRGVIASSAVSIPPGSEHVSAVRDE